jgi:nitrite reductase (NADH) small subunit
MDATLTERWVRICKSDDIPLLGARVVRRDGGDIAIFRNADDECFALLDRCPHKGGPLSQGIVFGRSVACPLHGLTVRLEDGCAEAPDTGCTRSFPVKIENGEVLLQFSD